MEKFFIHRRQCASEFFLDNFRERVNARSKSSRPDDCLLNAIFVLACWFTRTHNLAEIETTFVKKAREALNACIVTRPEFVLDWVRGSALIGLYYYGNGKMLQGYADVCSAVQLGRACGLEVIDSHVFRDPAGRVEIVTQAIECFKGMFTRTPFLLSLPESPEELGERIHVFWSLWIIDASGTATHGMDRAIDDTKINTPLPLPLRWYACGKASESNMRTLADFWASEGKQDESEPSMTLRIKATAVLEAACTLARLKGTAMLGDVSHDIPQAPSDPVDSVEFEARFKHIATTCDNLERSLEIALPNLPEDSEIQDTQEWKDTGIDPVMMHAKSVTQCAIICLHGIKFNYDEHCFQRALTAARRMVALLRSIRDINFEQVDIMLGVSDSSERNYSFFPLNENVHF